jgi:hypothetical protein
MLFGSEVLQLQDLTPIHTLALSIVGIIHMLVDRLTLLGV